MVSVGELLIPQNDNALIIYKAIIESSISPGGDLQCKQPKRISSAVCIVIVTLLHRLIPTLSADNTSGLA